jgi:hypothetical protein
MSDLPCSIQEVFDDLDWAEPELRLQQNRLVDELRRRGIGRPLAVALIEDLLAHKVFHAGAPFVDLTIFVRLDGCQTDIVTPNRFLHPTRDSWFRHLASRQAQRALHPAVASEALEDPLRQWLTLAEAERISGINRGVISRAVDAGDLASNGQQATRRGRQPSPETCGSLAGIACFAATVAKRGTSTACWKVPPSTW